MALDVLVSIKKPPFLVMKSVQFSNGQQNKFVAYNVPYLA